MFCRDSAQSVNLAFLDQFPAQAIECCSAPLPLPCGIGLFADANCKPADHKSDDEHYDKGHEIFNIMYCEAIVWRNKEEVERGDAQKRGE